MVKKSFEVNDAAREMAESLRTCRMNDEMDGVE